MAAESIRDREPFPIGLPKDPGRATGELTGPRDQDYRDLRMLHEEADPPSKIAIPGDPNATWPALRYPRFYGTHEL